ncbi:hypothetical protein [Burkholderia cenocepacia]|uniref:hypothetical protein n=1 Tax=Burkholderia cenocepacia TaxID=95486 RepID=UPI00158EF705|nr:hypothetical protein [Burkholderia cenocepacia]
MPHLALQAGFQIASEQMGPVMSCARHMLFAKPIRNHFMNLLNEKQLDSELSNLSVNQRLEKKLMPKEHVAKTKPLKI